MGGERERGRALIVSQKRRRFDEFLIAKIYCTPYQCPINHNERISITCYLRTNILYLVRDVTAYNNNTV